MILNIKPVRIETNNCFEAAITTIATYFNRNYALQYCDSWQFGYLSQYGDDTKEGFGTLYALANKEYSVEMLKKHHGIGININTKSNFAEFKSSVEKEITCGKPVIMFMDAYDCPWGPVYRKYHIAHFVIISGIDSDNFIFIDPYFSNNVEYIPIRDVEKMDKHFYITLDISDANEDNINWCSIINSLSMNAFGNNKCSNNFDAIRNFANDVEHFTQLYEDVCKYGNNFENYPIFFHLKNVSYSRLNLVQVLDFLSRKCNVSDLVLFADCFKKAAKMWIKARNMYIKFSLRPYDYTQAKKVGDFIREIADYEEKLALSILEYAKSHT